MKKIALLLCFLLVIGATELTNSYASPKETVINDVPPSIPDGAEIIVLIGQLDTNVGPDDVVAAIDDINVYVGFSRSFGYVNISIYDATDCLIYSNNVNTEYQRLATIPYLGGGHPAYIVLNSANGRAEGNF